MLSIKVQVSDIGMTSLNKNLVKLQKQCEKGDICSVIGEFVIDSLSPSGNNIYLINIHLYCIIIFSNIQKYYVQWQTALSVNSLYVSIVLVTVGTQNLIFINIFKFM